VILASRQIHLTFNAALVDTASYANCELLRDVGDGHVYVHGL
jgi:hypothetical protein